MSLKEPIKNDSMKNAYRKWIAGKLQKIRKETNLDQHEFSDGINLKRATYAAYEEGRAEPSLFTLEKICFFVKISVDSFLQDSPFKQAAKS